MSIVDNLYDEYTSIISFLTESNQPSLVSDTDRYFKKIIVLSSASFFEHEIQSYLVNFIKKSTNNNLKAINLLKKSAISGKYHTLFDLGHQRRSR